MFLSLCVCLCVCVQMSSSKSAEHARWSDASVADDAAKQLGSDEVRCVVLSAAADSLVID